MFFRRTQACITHFACTLLTCAFMNIVFTAAYAPPISSPCHYERVEMPCRHVRRRRPLEVLCTAFEYNFMGSLGGVQVCMIYARERVAASADPLCPPPLPVFLVCIKVFGIYSTATEPYSIEAIAKACDLRPEVDMAMTLLQSLVQVRPAIVETLVPVKQIASKTSGMVVPIAPSSKRRGPVDS